MDDYLTSLKNYPQSLHQEVKSFIQSIRDFNRLLRVKTKVDQELLSAFKFSGRILLSLSQKKNTFPEIGYVVDRILLKEASPAYISMLTLTIRGN
ncbi:MAG TPA: hypothetical protein VI912_03050 [Candidatus Bilamarchaeaceae archaeon]|nr:hypothetical protein [Candidatus Bilamarchaeaceae archaeon]